MRLTIQHISNDLLEALVDWPALANVGSIVKLEGAAEPVLAQVIRIDSVPQDASQQRLRFKVLCGVPTMSLHQGAVLNDQSLLETLASRQQLQGVQKNQFWGALPVSVETLGQLTLLSMPEAHTLTRFLAPILAPLAATHQVLLPDFTGIASNGGLKRLALAAPGGRLSLDDLGASYLLATLPQFFPLALRDDVMRCLAMVIPGNDGFLTLDTLLADANWHNKELPSSAKGPLLRLLNEAHRLGLFAASADDALRFNVLADSSHLDFSAIPPQWRPWVFEAVIHLLRVQCGRFPQRPKVLVLINPECGHQALQKICYDMETLNVSVMLIFNERTLPNVLLPFATTRARLHADGCLQLQGRISEQLPVSISLDPAAALAPYGLAIGAESAEKTTALAQQAPVQVSDRASAEANQGLLAAVPGLAMGPMPPAGLPEAPQGTSPQAYAPQAPVAQTQAQAVPSLTLETVQDPFGADISALISPIDDEPPVWDASSESNEHGIQGLPGLHDDTPVLQQVPDALSPSMPPSSPPSSPLPLEPVYEPHLTQALPQPAPVDEDAPPGDWLEFDLPVILEPNVAETLHSAESSYSGDEAPFGQSPLELGRSQAGQTSSVRPSFDFSHHEDEAEASITGALSAADVSIELMPAEDPFENSAAALFETYNDDIDAEAQALLRAKALKPEPMQSAPPHALPPMQEASTQETLGQELSASYVQPVVPNLPSAQDVQRPYPSQDPLLMPTAMAAPAMAANDPLMAMPGMDLAGGTPDAYGAAGEMSSPHLTSMPLSMQGADPFMMGMPPANASQEQAQLASSAEPLLQGPAPVIAESPMAAPSEALFAQGDKVMHAQYGQGVVQTVIDVGNRTILNIQFDAAGKRLLDPALSQLEKA
ncbi:MAG: hypothetical protein VKJ06_07265 [Vampirovibrionales bacterium]|nr:hypothetical protein [Vampirovibrionales bacterium]